MSLNTLEPVIMIFNTIGSHTIEGKVCIMITETKEIDSVDELKNKHFVIKANEGFRSALSENFNYLMSLGAASISFDVKKILN